MIDIFLTGLTVSYNADTRKIIHIDFDAFYASIEMRDNPKLQDKAVAVGGSPDKRGVIATCNYEARRFEILFCDVIFSSIKALSATDYRAASVLV